jgi:uncharacterized protein YjiS (DUF1127 family)
MITLFSAHLPLFLSTCVDLATTAAARLRQRRRARRQLQLLDGHALRDLGIDRSEWSSYEAEAAGLAAPTRRRISGPA